MRIPIPLLPMVVEVGWRPLGPFRFTTRGLMLLVLISGVYLSLAANTVRMQRAASDHAERSLRASHGRTGGPPPVPTPLELRHARLARQSHDAAALGEFLMAMIFLTMAALGVVAVVGRIIHGMRRRSAGVVLGIALGLLGGRAFAVTGAAGPDPVARQDPADDDEAARPIAPARPPRFLVRGLVIDAATKRPIARFRVVPGVWNGRASTWQPHLITIHRNGLFEWPDDGRAWDELRIRVEAEGYRPGVSRVVKESEGPIKLTFALEPDPGVAIVVRTSDGAPAVGARAAWATPSREATGRGATIGFYDPAGRLGAQVVTADAAGRLRLPSESDRGMIVVAHASGYAEVNPAELGAAGTVALRRWCRVEGRVLAGTKPVIGQKVRVYRYGAPGEDPPTHTWEDEAITDADGRFACDRVVAGRVVIDRVFSEGPLEWSVNGLATFVEIREEQATRVLLGGPGRTLVGRFRAPKDLGRPIDWSKVTFQIGLEAPHIGFPGDEPIWRTYRAFLNTEEGRAYHRDHLPVGPDGSFRVDSVPPGDYQLMIWVFGPAVGRPDETRETYAAGGARVELSPVRDEGGDVPLSLGTIELRKYLRNK